MIRLSLSFLCAVALIAQIPMITGCSSAHTQAVNTPASGGGTGGTGGGTGGSGGSGGGSSGGSGGSSGGSGGSGGGSGGSGGSGGTGGTGGGTGSGGGTGNGGSSTKTTTTGAEYLYAVANGQQGSVYGWKIDSSTGALSAVSGSPFQVSVGTQTYTCMSQCYAALVPDPLGRFLFYPYSYSAAGITTLSVNPTTGAVSTAANSATSTYEVSAEPKGRYLYWNESGTSDAIGGLAISSSGALSPTPGQPYAYSGQVSYGNPAVTSTNVYAIEYLGSGNASQASTLYNWTIDAATGTLTQTGNTATLQDAANPVITPNGKFIYVQQIYFSNNVGYYETVPVQVGSNGALTVLTQDAQQTSSNGPNNVWMSPNGNFLYVGAMVGQSGQLWDYQINQTTGALTLVQKYTNINPGAVAFDPSDQYVYINAANSSNIAQTTIQPYSVNPTTGALTALSNGTFDLKAVPVGLAVVAAPAQ